MAAPRRRKTKRPITAEDLCRLRFLSSPRISPDGTRIVFVHKRFGERNAYDTNLWMVDADGGARPRAFTRGDRDGHPRWSPDGGRIAFLSAREKDRPQIALIDAGGGEAAPLTDLPEGSIGTFEWSPTGRHVAFTFRPTADEWTSDARRAREEEGRSDPPRVVEDWWYRLDGDGYFGEQRHALRVVDVETGEDRVLHDASTLGEYSFSFSPDGRQLAFSTSTHEDAVLDARHERVHVVPVRGGRARVLPDQPAGPKTSVAWSPDGALIAFAGREGQDGVYSTENLELWVLDAAGGGARCLTGREDYCLMAATLSDTADVSFQPTLRWDPRGKRIFLGIGWHGEEHVASIAARGGRLRFHTRGAAHHALGNLSADGRRMALMRTTATRPPEVHVAEAGRDAFELSALTALNKPLLSELALSRPRSHWVTTAPGVRAQLWELEPPEPVARRRRPGILQVHGGPHAQYGVPFFHEMQLLAAQGYSVFYGNPRGSKGYGRDHCASIRGAWGTTDWEDVEAFARFMRERPYVDAERTGIMGGSYGGYMTNWAIGHTDVFRAAITDRCVSNLVSMWGNSDYPEPPDLYWEGNTWDRTDALWRASPLQFLGACSTPTLIIHSEGDLRCNVEQAEQVFTVLKHRQVPTRFVRYPRETSHGMSRAGPPDMRLHRLGEILSWWQRWLKR